MKHKKWREEQQERRKKGKLVRQAVEDFNKKLVKTRRKILRLKAKNDDLKHLSQLSSQQISEAAEESQTLSIYKSYDSEEQRQKDAMQETLQGFAAEIYENQQKMDENEKKMARLRRLEARLTALIS